MGLINEIICRHTYQGKPLPSNIVYIASCNPYRQKENLMKGIGLNVREVQKEIEKMKKPEK